MNKTGATRINGLGEVEFEYEKVYNDGARYWYLSHAHIRALGYPRNITSVCHRSFDPRDVVSGMIVDIQAPVPPSHADEVAHD